MMKQIPCTECNGSGKTTFINLPEDPRPEGITETCLVCEGKGYTLPKRYCPVCKDEIKHETHEHTTERCIRSLATRIEKMQIKINELERSKASVWSTVKD